MKLPERRYRWRLVTLKNAAWFLGVAVALFLIVSTWNEHRRRDPARERLYERGHRAPAAPARPRPEAEIVIAGEPAFPAPSSLQRESPLPSLRPLPPIPTVAPPPPPATLRRTKQRGERVVVTNGPEECGSKFARCRPHHRRPLPRRRSSRQTVRSEPILDLHHLEGLPVIVDGRGRHR